jgi:cell wall-associated NlpC family hydrolase
LSTTNCGDLLGIQYKKNGRDRNGLDCYGLVKLVHLRQGKTLPEYDTPDDSNSIISLIETGKLSCKELPEPKEGCIVLFRIPPYKLHMGVVVGDGKFIHIIENRNVAIERLDHRMWSKLRVGYYEWK